MDKLFLIGAWYERWRDDRKAKIIDPVTNEEVGILRENHTYYDYGGPRDMIVEFTGYSFSSLTNESFERGFSKSDIKKYVKLINGNLYLLLSEEYAKEIVAKKQWKCGN